MGFWLGRPIKKSGRRLWVDEYRTGEKRTESDQPLLTDTGTAAFALIFHPRLVGNFDIRCEGKADVPGGPAWQVRFEESADPKKSFHQIRIKNSIYPLRFKGRAWIATDNFEILRLQTDLIAPIPQIDLQVERVPENRRKGVFLDQRLILWFGAPNPGHP